MVRPHPDSSILILMMAQWDVWKKDIVVLLDISLLLLLLSSTLPCAQALRFILRQVYAVGSMITFVLQTETICSSLSQKFSKDLSLLAIASFSPPTIY